MITVYGADWCEDTRRSLRHLRRLAVAHEYINIDEDAEALARAKALNGGVRRTPTIDLGIGGPALVEPDNDTLVGGAGRAPDADAGGLHERLGVQNVGDTERMLRAGVGAALVLGAGSAPRACAGRCGSPVAVALLTGSAAGAPLYHAAGVSSLEGPGDRPDEAHRATWLAPATSSADAGGPRGAVP